MTKDWFSAGELAGVVGMPATVRGINKAAKRAGWRWRQRTGRGGGREYHIDALPPETQQSLRHQAAVAAVNKQAALDTEALAELAGAPPGGTPQQKEAQLAALAALPPGAKRSRAKARAWLIKRAAEYRAAQGCGQKAALRAFARDYQAGEIAVPEKYRAWLPRYEGARGLSAGTLERWTLAYRHAGLAALVDGYGNRRGQSKIEQNAALKRVVIGALLQAPHITPKKVKQYLEAAHPDLNIVSTKGIERFLKRWKADNAQTFCYLTNPDKWKNVYMAAHGSQHAAVVRLNQLWELDSTPADWMLKDGRHSVIGCIDLYSRRLKFQVSKTSTAAAVCALTRRAMLDWGVPESVRTDNGKDYVSEQYATVLEALEIPHVLCIPFASEEKGTIERAMQTLSHGVLDLLPGFIGHNVSERKVIEARKSFAKRVMSRGETVEVELTAAELQAVLDQWTDKLYAFEAHRGEGMEGKTPFEKAQGWREPVRRIADARALDALLAPIAGQGTIHKKGLKLDHYHYIHPALGARIGEDVHLKRDEADLGRLYVYSLEGEFICVAECPELTGIDRAEWAAAAKALQKKDQAAKAKEVKQNQKAVRRNIPQAIIDYRIEQSNNVAAFPQQSVAYTTAGLTEAGKAARASDAPETAAPSADEKAKRAALVAELYTEAPKPETARQTFQRWVRLARRARDGEQLSGEQARFVAAYQTGVTAAVEYDQHLDFGILVDGVAVDVKPAAAEQKKARVARA